MQMYRSVQWSFQNSFAAVALGSTWAATVVLFVVTDMWDEAPWVAWPCMVLLAATLLTPMSVVANRDGITVRLAGMAVRRLGYEEITHLERRDYQPLREFGGWGVRWSMTSRNARAYTTAGTTAVVLTLREGQEVYLGVADEQGLIDALAVRVTT